MGGFCGIKEGGLAHHGRIVSCQTLGDEGSAGRIRIYDEDAHGVTVSLSKGTAGHFSGAQITSSAICLSIGHHPLNKPALRSGAVQKRQVTSPGVHVFISPAHIFTLRGLTP